ncbi:MAG: class I SAM-dependent methyltransferase, partial [Candidatus Eremiobacteraeota bacterium]|nr:class I SAM-dependent methyltransferase [Candidatus Eremiobacteraeota bacterium]
EPFYPLRAYVCEACFLVQLEAFEPPETIFASDYPYYSSYSTTWLEHCKRFADDTIGSLGLGPESLVVELASNDGYLLRWFRDRGVPVLGVEPAEGVAREAIASGIPTRVEFFGVESARELAAGGQQADLLIGNNVLAHVPDLRDFVGGFVLALKPEGRISLEFPHVLNLIRGRQFDTIYHEHFSYFSLSTVATMFGAHGLSVIDVETLTTHGGSLRVWAALGEAGILPSARVEEALERERAAGLDRLETYRGFGAAVAETKRAFLEFLIRAKRDGLSIAAYGAPAKGNTLLNYCGVRSDFIEYTVDRSPHKQGRYLPGTHIPIYPVERLAETKPDLVVILPWNLQDEIVAQVAHVRDWGGRFVVPIPEARVLP